VARPPTILLLAGEASGDQYGSRLAQELRARLGEVHLVGLGGPAMAAAGVTLHAGLDELAVMGITEVVRHLGFFRRLERQVRKLLESGEIDLVLAIDFAGFNIRVARAAHAERIPVLWYVAPKVWAWKQWRAKALARHTDEVAVILPFEEPFLRQRGVNASYVGNPVADRPALEQDRGTFCARWTLDPDRPIVGILPGSRRQEIERHLAPFAEAVAGVAAVRPDIQPVIARAAHLPKGALEDAGLPVVDDTRGVLAYSAAALVKSGTGTLETAMEGTPMVVAYETSALTWWIVSRAVTLDHWALPNLVAGERIVPEFIQGDMKPHVLTEALIDLLDPASPARRRQLEGLARVRELVGGPGAAGRVAEMAVRLLGVDA
jgi:lipid-A-disaccharide synthase